MKRYRYTLSEQETIINWDNELDTASVYTFDRRIYCWRGGRSIR